MDKNDYVKIAENQKDHLKVALDPKGELWICSNNKEWQALEFNKLYKNYYPYCIFTDLLYCNRGFVAAGQDLSGMPIVMQSLLGQVWNALPLHAVSPFKEAVRVTGIINRMLFDEYSGQLYLLCENGKLAVLPDCPKCLKIHKIAAQPLIDGCVEREYVKIKLKDGSIQRVSKCTVEQQRVSKSFAEKFRNEKHIFVDLRSSGEGMVKHNDSIAISSEDVAEWLQSVDKDVYIFFFCNWGVQADSAAHYARGHGWKQAFSLGGVKEGFHVE